MTAKTKATDNGQAGAATTAPLPEAPVSVTVKLLYRGRDTMLTLRGHDGAEGPPPPRHG